MELPICKDRPGTCFVFRKCSKKFLGICTKREWDIEYLDLNDSEIRNKLIDMGYRLKRD